MNAPSPYSYTAITFSNGTIVPDAANSIDYLYSSKEFNFRGSLGWYDYGARWYDPAIGRWNAIDPLAEKYYQFGTNVYCVNNPIRFIDPDGRDGMVTGSGTKEDPYIITANYYYQTGSLNKDQIEGLEGAVSSLNNAGRRGMSKIKNNDGTESYVKFNLSVQEVDNVGEVVSGDISTNVDDDPVSYGIRAEVSPLVMDVGKYGSAKGWGFI